MELGPAVTARTRGSGMKGRTPRRTCCLRLLCFSRGSMGVAGANRPTWSSGWLMLGFLHRRLLASVSSLPLPFQPPPHALVPCCGRGLHCTAGETEAQGHEGCGPVRSASRPHAGPCSEGRWVGPRPEQSAASPMALPHSPQTLGVTFPAPWATPTPQHQQSSQLSSPDASHPFLLWSRQPACPRGPGRPGLLWLSGWGP